MGVVPIRFREIPASYSLTNVLQTPRVQAAVYLEMWRGNFTGSLLLAWLYARAGNLTDLELSDVPLCWRYIFVGVFVGFRVGVLVGVSVGVLVDVFVGFVVGVLVGVSVGVLVGVLIGFVVGVFVGFVVGVFVGFVVGVSVGIFVGVLVGLTLDVLAASGAAPAFMNEPIPRDKTSVMIAMTASK
jgi:hypothetical protein